MIEASRCPIVSGWTGLRGASGVALVGEAAAEECNDGESTGGWRLSTTITKGRRQRPLLPRLWHPLEASPTLSLVFLRKLCRPCGRPSGATSSLRGDLAIGRVRLALRRRFRRERLTLRRSYLSHPRSGGDGQGSAVRRRGGRTSHRDTVQRENHPKRRAAFRTVETPSGGITKLVSSLGAASSQGPLSPPGSTPIHS